MAVQTATPPQTSVEIISRRATCAGIQYTVEDVVGTHTVTVHNGCTGCTCGLDAFFVHCPHRLEVEKREQVYVAEAEARAAYVDVFSIYL